VNARPKVWITRAEPGAAATAARIAALGFEPLVAPVLTIGTLDTPIDLTDVDTLAFTSANGVRAFASACPRRDLAVFAVGDTTAEAAQRSGFADVASADDDVAGLGRLIVARRPGGVVLLPGPVERAGDLAGALTRQGLNARKLDLYRSEAVQSLPAPAAAALDRRSLAAILIHSPRAAATVAGLLTHFDISGVAVIGLSSACLAPLESLLVGVAISAAAPREDALLTALLAALGNGAAPR
jgi:uroporphyrinogen-III synthase